MTAIQPQFLFACGCPRTGTTALLKQINSDPRMIMGEERFKLIRKTITPQHFERERFFDVQKGDTNFKRIESFEELSDRWTQTATPRYIGDKTPQYFLQLQYLLDTFPDSRILFCFRDLYRVASSFNVRAKKQNGSWQEWKDYTVALEQWNKSLKKLRQLDDSVRKTRVYIVDYDAMTGDDPEWLDKLYAFLQLDVNEEARAGYAALLEKAERVKKKPLRLSDEQTEFLDQGRDLDLEQWAKSLSGQA